MLQSHGLKNDANALGLQQAAENTPCVSSNLHNHSARHRFSFLQVIPLWFRVVRSPVQGHAVKTWSRWNEKLKGIMTGYREYSLISEVSSARWLEGEKDVWPSRP